MSGWAWERDLAGLAGSPLVYFGAGVSCRVVSPNKGLSSIRLPRLGKGYSGSRFWVLEEGKQRW